MVGNLMLGWEEGSRLNSRAMSKDSLVVNLIIK